MLIEEDRNWNSISFSNAINKWLMFNDNLAKQYETYKILIDTVIIFTSNIYIFFLLFIMDYSLFLYLRGPRNIFLFHKHEYLLFKYNQVCLNKH